MTIDDFEDSIIEPIRRSSRAEKWIIRIVGAALGFGVLMTCNFVYDMSMQLQALREDMAAISRELTIVKPSEVLKTLRELEQGQLRISDVKSVVSEHRTQWDIDRDEWHTWRRNVEYRLRELESARKRGYR